MPHRRNLSSLSKDERKQLADLIGQFLHDAIIREHEHVFANNDHSVFFQNHRTYIGKLEDFLAANGGGAFVPLPFWNDDDAIPSSFDRVERLDNGVLRPKINPHWSHTPRHHRLPAEAKPPTLCERADFDHIPDFVHVFEHWHQEVHALLGPVMALGAIWDAPAAYIFWPWHAFNDEIYHRWEHCRLRPISAIAGGCNADGRVEAFVLGKNARPWHAWAEFSGRYAEWSLWHRLHDPGELSQLAVETNQDGRLEAFALDANAQLRHTWQHAPNGDWNEWMSLGGALKRFVAARDSAGRLAVFAIDATDRIRYRHQLAPNSGWGPWIALGPADRSVASLAVAQHRGRMELFALTSDRRLLASRQAAGHGAWSAWTEMSEQLRFVEVVAATHSDGHLQVFGLAADGRIHYKWRRPVSGQWNGAWREMAAPAGAHALRAAIDVDNALVLFAIDQQSALRSNRESIPTASVAWSGWRDTGSVTAGQASSLGVERYAVVKRQDAGLDIFAAMRNDVVWRTRQNAQNFPDWERWRLI